jgi:hypothetical protein
MKKNNMDKLDEINLRLDKIVDQLNEINEAFPDGVHAHRMAHEAMIKAATAEESFWRELKLEIAKKGLIGLVIILVGLVLAGVSVKLGLGIK